MKRLFSALLLLFIQPILIFTLVFDTYAADWYIRAAATGGTNAGTSWTNAWLNISNIVWASVSPGDTIWIAGGGATTYSQWTCGKSGTSDDAAGRIFHKRATVAAHGSGAGWNDSYDTQVSIAKILFNSTTLCNYITWDGQQTDGIKTTVAAGAGSVGGVQWDRGAIYDTIQYVEVAGPCGAAPCLVITDIRGIDATAQSNELVGHLQLRYNHLHGLNTMIYLVHGDNAIIEHNDIHDNNDTDVPPGNPHPNILFTFMSNNVTFRFNNVHNYGVEGIVFKSGGAFGTSGTWYVHNNLWYRGPGTSGGPFDRVLEANGSGGSGVSGPVYFYNNTMVNLWQSWRGNANGGTWHPLTEGKNNIYYNTPVGNPAIGDGPPIRDFEFSTSAVTGASSISSGSNPFVNLAGFDFHLISTVAATYPRDKGTNLNPASQYLYDYDGNVANGAPDMGAYEYGGTSPGAAPAAPTNAHITGASSNTDVQIVWEASADTVSGYHLYRGTTTGVYPTLVATKTAASALATLQPITQHFDRLLVPGTYFWIVKSFDANGTESMASSEMTATITGMTARAPRLQ